MGKLQLGRVPGNGHEELIIKASISGITLLKENSFRKRYTGNKHSAVDINGQLWLKAAALKKAIALQAVESALRVRGGDWAVLQWDGKLPAKKKARVETQAGQNKLKKMNEVQISENLSTTESPLLTVSNELSPKKERSYRVHKREVRQRLLGFMNTQAGKKELYFWTVTFPEGTPDHTAYKIYNIWLTALRQRGMLKDYIWVAERQDGKRNDYQHATNTIHFHIGIPHKMPVHRANSMMQGTLKTFSKRGEIPCSVYACKRYNGVHIAKNKKTGRTVNFAIKKGSRSLVTYLTKYVTKNDAEFSHLAWHNSRGYSSIFTGVTFTIKEFINNGWPALLNRAKRFDTDFFTFVPWLSDPPPALINHLYDLNTFLQTQLN